MPAAVNPLAIPDVILIRPSKYEDDRGYFAETYRSSWLEDIRPAVRFVQANQSFSAKAGTIRGLHFQRPPAAQAKLVRALAGSIFDVAVDLRHDSPTFGQWVGATLTAASLEALFIPRGFAHGFCTLEPATEVAYECDNYFSREHEGGIHFADATLGVNWPVQSNDAIVSEKDGLLPRLTDWSGSVFSLADSQTSEGF